MYYLISFVFGVVCGGYFVHNILPLITRNESFIEKQQDRAIQKHYDLKPNEYTYFYEGEDDFYILTFKEQERRIKFSKNRPYNVIYDAIVDITPVDTD